MVEIVQRLPMYLQGRWRKTAISEFDVYGHYPSIDKLLAFLDKVSREVSDPVFGVLGHDVRDKNVGKPRGKGLSGRKGSSLVCSLATMCSR